MMGARKVDPGEPPMEIWHALENRWREAADRQWGISRSALRPMGFA
jgi:hypothetical protein